MTVLTPYEETSFNSHLPQVTPKNLLEREAEMESQGSDF